MDERIEKLRGWGCNITEALERMADDEDFYLECLQDVLTDQYFARLEEALRARDVELAFNAAHTLKGVFANVGLTPMYEQVCAIVEPLRAGSAENLMDRLETLLHMKERLAKILKG